MFLEKLNKISILYLQTFLNIIISKHSFFSNTTIQKQHILETQKKVKKNSSYNQVIFTNIEKFLRINK